MLKKAFLWGVFVAALVVLLVYYLGTARLDYAITINGEEIRGLPGLALAAGGLLVAGLAAAGALALVALVLAGTSMVLLGALAVVFLALLFAFSPVLAPVAGVAILMALAIRRRKDGSGEGKG